MELQTTESYTLLRAEESRFYSSTPPYTLLREPRRYLSIGGVPEKVQNSMFCTLCEANGSYVFVQHLVYSK